MTDTRNNNIVFVTGLSGAGMTHALKNLEDLGYESLDNFPLSQIDALLAETADNRPIAFGIDTRTRDFDVQKVLDKARSLNARLLFLFADEAVLQKRFTETRRRHPLAKDRPASAGIKKEMTLLFPLREAAEAAIDTSELSVHDLRARIDGHFRIEEANALTLTLMSFGYKYGLPREADIVFDARFLRNPHWDEKLRPLSGREADVGAYIEADPAFAGFLENFKKLIIPLLPRYKAEGKSYLTIAVGCSGGRHRSVYIIEKIGQFFQSENVSSHVEHRDLERAK